MTLSGKLLLFSMVFIVIPLGGGGVLSVSGRDCILLMYCHYAVVLCLVGWLES